MIANFAGELFRSFALHACMFCERETATANTCNKLVLFSTIRRAATRFTHSHCCQFNFSVNLLHLLRTTASSLLRPHLERTNIMFSHGT